MLEPHELRGDRERAEFECVKTGHIARKQRHFDRLWVNREGFGSSNRESVEVWSTIELGEGLKERDVGFVEVTPQGCQTVRVRPDMLDCVGEHGACAEVDLERIGS